MPLQIMFFRIYAAVFMARFLLVQPASSFEIGHPRVQYTPQTISSLVRSAQKPGQQLFRRKITTVHVASQMQSRANGQQQPRKELIGTPYLSGNPVMDKIDQVEREMSKNQREAHDMIEMLRNDLKMQQLLRHESHAAYDRLKDIKTDMVMQLNQMKEHYEDDRKRMVRDFTQQLRDRDEKITEYENEMGSVRALAKRLILLLLSKFTKIGERFTERLAKQKAAVAHAFE